MKLKELTINYQLLSEAISFYRKKGYKLIELPWMVYAPYSMLTCPSEEYAFKVDLDGTIKHLVGSAEQAFLQEFSWGDSKFVSYTKYMAITPCFRRGEDDETHSEQFIKLELFESSDFPAIYDVKEAHDSHYLNHELSQDIMISDAMDLFKSLGCKNQWMKPVDFYNPYLENTKDPVSISTLFSVDIYGGTDSMGLPIEIGSYGLRRQDIRKMSGTIRRWYAYGTGIALPRFQLVI